MILVALGLYALVFGAGAYAGWEKTRQTDALVRAALPETYVARRQGELFLQIRCAGPASEAVYLQRLRDNRYERARFDRHGRVVGTAIDMINNSTIQTVVLGAAGGEAYRSTLKHLRQRAFGSSLHSWRARGQTGAIVLAALTAYPLGEYLLSRLPPTCGSETALSLFDEPSNRARLAVEVFLQDERRLNRYQTLRSLAANQGRPCARFRSSPEASMPDIRSGCPWLVQLDEEHPYSSLARKHDEETYALRDDAYSVDEFERLATRCRAAQREAGIDVCLSF